MKPHDPTPAPADDAAPADDVAPDAKSGAVPTPGAPPGVRRILVADDDFLQRQLLTRLLGQLAHAELHEARDGPAALERFHVLRPQITLLDIDMPGDLDGMAVLEQIRALDPGAFVAMVSAYSKLETVQRAVSLGVRAFVVKPHSARRIHDVLRQYAAVTGDAGLLKDG